MLGIWPGEPGSVDDPRPWSVKENRARRGAIKIPSSQITFPVQVRSTKYGVLHMLIRSPGE